MKVAGVDGTKSGWVAVVLDAGGLSAFSASTISQVHAALGDAVAIAIDMPIGFPDRAMSGGRACEALARRAMPGRGSTVFSSPARIALSASSYEEASAMNRATSEANLGLSKQSFALFDKMREIDNHIATAGQEILFEVHPELSFTLLAKAANMPERLPSKHEFDGMAARIALLKGEGMDPTALLAVRRELRAKSDDIVDATVACWTAARRAKGLAIRFPETPPRDAVGLFMELWA